MRKTSSSRPRRGKDFRALALLLAVVSGSASRADDPGRDLPATDGRQPFVVTGYLPWYRAAEWSPDTIGPVTDLIFYGVRLRPDGRLNTDTLTPAVMERLHAARRANGCRILLCVGGGGQSEGFDVASASETARVRLSTSLAELCRTHGLNGIDFDWEYPRGDRELQAFARLLAETKRRLGEGGMVSVAQSPWRDFGEEVYRTVDRVHVMSYNHRHPQAQMEKSRQDIERMLGYGCPARKLVLGVPFYGRNARGRTKTFDDLAEFGRLDPAADMLLGYAYNGRETVRAKTRYALEQSLAGIMVWELGQDVTDPDVSLLHGIELELSESSRLPGRRPRESVTTN